VFVVILDFVLHTVCVCLFFWHFVVICGPEFLNKLHFIQNYSLIYHCSISTALRQRNDKCVTCLSVKLHLRHKKQTNLQRDTSVCLSVVSVRGVHPTNGRSAVLHRNLEAREGKNQGSTVIVIKILPPNAIPGFCFLAPFVHLFVCVLDGV